MPERQVIRWINAHSTVVAPAAGRDGLVSTARDQRRFALRESIWGITKQAPRITNGWLQGVARNAVTDRHVSKRIHTDAWHPAPESIRVIIKSLLLQRSRRNRASGNNELIPADG